MDTNILRCGFQSPSGAILKLAVSLNQSDAQIMNTAKLCWKCKQNPQLNPTAGMCEDCINQPTPSSVTDEMVENVARELWKFESHPALQGWAYISEDIRNIHRRCACWHLETVQKQHGVFKAALGEWHQADMHNAALTKERDELKQQLAIAKEEHQRLQAAIEVKDKILKQSKEILITASNMHDAIATSNMIDGFILGFAIDKALSPPAGTGLIKP